MYNIVHERAGGGETRLCVKVWLTLIGGGGGPQNEMRMFVGSLSLMEKQV